MLNGTDIQCNIQHRNSEVWCYVLLYDDRPLLVVTHACTFVDTMHFIYCIKPSFTNDLPSPMNLKFCCRGWTNQKTCTSCACSPIYTQKGHKWVQQAPYLPLHVPCKVVSQKKQTILATTKDAIQNITKVIKMIRSHPMQLLRRVLALACTICQQHTISLVLTCICAVDMLTL